jgi:hypothetical protein
MDAVRIRVGEEPRKDLLVHDHAEERLGRPAESVEEPIAFEQHAERRHLERDPVAERLRTAGADRGRARLGARREGRDIDAFRAREA